MTNLTLPREEGFSKVSPSASTFRIPGPGWTTGGSSEPDALGQAQCANKNDECSGGTRRRISEGEKPSSVTVREKTG